MRVKVLPIARRDISAILDESQTDFGSLARQRYRALIDQALKDLGDQGAPLGARGIPELGEAYFAYHLRFARIRQAGTGVRQPRHVIICRLDPKVVVVLRVLRERQVFARHVHLGPNE